MKPARKYTIERVSHEVEVTKCTRVNGRFEYHTVTECGGYMVHFPQGHSTYFSDERRLHEAGIDVNDNDQFIDMDSGEIIPLAFVPRGLAASKSVR